MLTTWRLGFQSVTNLTLNKVENVGGVMYNTHHNKQKEKQMEIGQTYTTTQSGVTGIIKAVDNHPSGVNRILLDVNGTERWTSAYAE